MWFILSSQSANGVEALSLVHCAVARMMGRSSRGADRAGYPTSELDSIVQSVSLSPVRINASLLGTEGVKVLGDGWLAG